MLININFSALKWLLAHFKKQIPLAALAAFTGVIISLCYVALALLSKEIINAAQSGADYLKIFSFAGWILFILALQVALNIFANNLSVRLRSKMAYALNNTVFLLITKKKYSVLTSFLNADLLNRLVIDSQNIADSAVSLITKPISFAARIVACSAVLIAISPAFALIIGAYMFIWLFFGRIYKKNIKNLYKACRQQEGKIYAFISEALDNMIILKAFNAADTTVQNLQPLQAADFKARLKRNAFQNLSSTLTYLLFNAGYYSALIWGVFSICNNSMSMGTLVSLLQIISQIQAPIKNASGITTQFYEMMASVERLLELENLQQEPTAFDFKNPPFNALYLKNVSFSYDEKNITPSTSHSLFNSNRNNSDVSSESLIANDKKVIRNLSFCLKKGEIVGLYGMSGIGKTTVFKLLLGLYSCHSGEIYLDSDGRTFPVDESTRQFFAFVPQGNMLFAGSLRQNILYGADEKLDDDKLMEIVKICCLQPLLDHSFQGLERFIGPRGLGLSEGQAQRVAVARAIASGAPVLLLDEFTSALDESTEQQMIDGIKNLNRSCIIISHKKSTLNHCDKIIELL